MFLVDKISDNFSQELNRFKKRNDICKLVESFKHDNRDFVDTNSEFQSKEYIRESFLSNIFTEQYNEKSHKLNRSSCKNTYQFLENYKAFTEDVVERVDFYTSKYGRLINEFNNTYTEFKVYGDMDKICSDIIKTSGKRPIDMKSISNIDKKLEDFTVKFIDSFNSTDSTIDKSVSIDFDKDVFNKLLEKVTCFTTYSIDSLVNFKKIILFAEMAVHRVNRLNEIVMKLHTDTKAVQDNLLVNSDAKNSINAFNEEIDGVSDLIKSNFDYIDRLFLLLNDFVENANSIYKSYNGEFAMVSEAFEMFHNYNLISIINEEDSNQANKGANTEKKKNFFLRFLDGIVNFFKKIFSWITGKNGPASTEKQAEQIFQDISGMSQEAIDAANKAIISALIQHGNERSVLICKNAQQNGTQGQNGTEEDKTSYNVSNTYDNLSNNTENEKEIKKFFYYMKAFGSFIKTDKEGHNMYEFVSQDLKNVNTELFDYAKKSCEYFNNLKNADSDSSKNVDEAKFRELLSAAKNFNNYMNDKVDSGLLTKKISNDTDEADEDGVIVTQIQNGGYAKSPATIKKEAEAFANGTQDNTLDKNIVTAYGKDNNKVKILLSKVNNSFQGKGISNDKVKNQIQGNLITNLFNEITLKDKVKGFDQFKEAATTDANNIKTDIEKLITEWHDIERTTTGTVNQTTVNQTSNGQNSSTEVKEQKTNTYQPNKNRSLKTDANVSNTTENTSSARYQKLYTTWKDEVAKNTNLGLVQNIFGNNYTFYTDVETTKDFVTHINNNFKPMREALSKVYTEVSNKITNFHNTIKGLSTNNDIESKIVDAEKKIKEATAEVSDVMGFMSSMEKDIAKLYSESYKIIVQSRNNTPSAQPQQ